MDSYQTSSGNPWADRSRARVSSCRQCRPFVEGSVLDLSTADRDSSTSLSQEQEAIKFLEDKLLEQSHRLQWIVTKRLLVIRGLTEAVRV